MNEWQSANVQMKQIKCGSKNSYETQFLKLSFRVALAQVEFCTGIMVLVNGYVSRWPHIRLDTLVGY